MNRRCAGVLAVGALVLLGSATGAAGVSATPAAGAGDKPCSLPADPSTRDCLDRFTLASGARLPYYGSYSLSGTPAVTQAVIVVHGTGRNAQGYFGSIEKAADDAGVGSGAVLIAPDFQTEEDGPADGDAYWTNSGETSWKDGGDAVSPKGLSSYAVVDELLTTLGDRSRFPKLTRITLVGHSAGGQFVQRYAVGGRAPSRLRDTAVRYVTANPSSYLYFDPQRPDDTGLPGSCPDYDDYKYGLQHRNTYMNALTGQQLRDQYAARHAVYLLGGDDVHQDHGIDTSCSAKAQGDNRLDRGRAYFSYIQKGLPAAKHSMVIVPGVGHDNDAMFDSSQGRTAIFGN